MNQRAVAQMELHIAQSIIKSERVHYQRLMELSERMQVLRHDGKHALAATKRLLQQGEVDSAGRMLSALEREYDRSQMTEYCKNRAVNAYLNSFAERCAAADTSFDARLRMPDRHRIDDYELCVVLGNLLENAMAASEPLPPERRSINLTVKLHGDQIGILVRNAIMDAPRLVRGRLVSRSPQGGRGIKSIEAIARKYCGGYFPEWDSGEFRAYVTLSVEAERVGAD